jgi:hypothetical protein
MPSAYTDTRVTALTPRTVYFRHFMSARELILRFRSLLRWQGPLARVARMCRRCAAVTRRLPLKDPTRRDDDGTNACGSANETTHNGTDVVTSTRDTPGLISG